MTLYSLQNSVSYIFSFDHYNEPMCLVGNQNRAKCCYSCEDYIICVMIFAFSFSENLRLPLDFHISILWQVITWKEFAGSEFNSTKFLRF